MSRQNQIAERIGEFPAAGVAGQFHHEFICCER